MPRRKESLIGLALIVTLTLSGCGFGAPRLTGLTPPCSAANSKQAADRLMQRVDQSSSPGKTFTLTVTNEEATSVLNQIIDRAKQESGGAPIPIQNPVVCFKSGKTVLFGKVNLLGMNADALITISATVNRGRASFRVEQVELGSFSVPRELTVGLSDAISAALNEGVSEVQFTAIQMQEGQIRMSGLAP